MNFGGRLNRVKQQADRLFLRGDKTDVIGELREAEELTEELRVLTEAFYKSEEKCLNTHHVLDEKKHRKVPENQAAEILKEALKDAPQNGEENALYRCVVEEVAGTEQLLAKIVLDHEEHIEAEVLNPLSKLLREDFPTVAKHKKALKQAGIDVDAAKARLRNSQSNLGQVNKIEIHKEELEDAVSKLEQIKDSYAAELFTVLSKQREIARLSCLSLEIKLDYLQKSYTKLNTIIPSIRSTLHSSSCSAIFGISLHDHLRMTGNDIAFPIQICVRRIIETGIREEGIFRVAGSAGKIKRLKGAFDAGLVTSDMFSHSDYHRDYDVHVVSGTLKCYLRELPEPLLTFLHHDDLIEAVRKSDHDEKLRSLWQIVNSLPSQNQNNLRYIIKFLSLLAGFSVENKMTPNNIAIVIAPNLIWAQREADDVDIIAMGRNMSLGNDYRTIVEQLIEYCDYFFKDDVNFGVSVPKKIELPSSPNYNSTSQRLQSSSTGKAIGHQRNRSADFNTVVPGEGTSSVDSESPKQPHRMRKKPAPQPPQKGTTSLVSSGDELSSQGVFSFDSPEMSRSKSPLINDNVLNAGVPAPAPRLYHTNSLRRPTAEPPKPPAGTSVPATGSTASGTLATISTASTTETTSNTGSAKPPRPNPPVYYSENSKDSKTLNPIGFERIQKDNADSSDIGFIDDEPTPLFKNQYNKDKQVPIGFVVDGCSDKGHTKDAQIHTHSDDSVQLRHVENDSSKEKSPIVQSEFRKSLEGVLKQQPQTLPRHMVRASTGSEVYGTEKKDGEKGFQLPNLPVPTLRSTKDVMIHVTEKPEPVPRSDKPTIPEKPVISNRSVVSVDHSRPIIPEKPANVAIRTNSISKKNEINNLVKEGVDEKSVDGFSRPLEDIKNVNSQQILKSADCENNEFPIHETVESEKLHSLKPVKPDKPSILGRTTDVPKSTDNSINFGTDAPVSNPSDSTNL